MYNWDNNTSSLALYYKNQWWLEIHISQNELDKDSVISLSGLTHDVFKAYEYKILALKH